MVPRGFHMKINIIAAIGLNNEIGLNKKLLWKSKSDLEHFKALTLGKPIIMGRKTFESLPGILPGRQHIVITSNPLGKLNSTHQDRDNVVFVGSLETAIDICEFDDLDCFIIGGASIYEQALPLADELHISHMNWTGKADTYFPIIGDEWNNTPHDWSFGVGSEPDWLYKTYTKNN